MFPTNRILAVDDNPTNLAIVEEALEGRYSLRMVEDGEAALRLAPSFRPDIVLLDVMMPRPDGYEVCSRLKNDRCMGPTHVIMVSAKTDLESRLRGYHAGADDYLCKPFSEEELLAKVSVSLRTKSIYQVIRGQLEGMCGAAGEALELVSQLRDAESAGHLMRMRDYSQILASEMQATSHADLIDERFLDDLYRASPLHDVGKVAIPDVILCKPGPLTPEERATMQKHAIFGERILNRLAKQQPEVSMFKMASQIARWHHESFDGTGYPDGLAGDGIPLAARIVKVADVFDALTSVRVYKDRESPEDARDQIVAGRGKEFDPGVVNAMLCVFDDIRELALSAEFVNPSPVCVI